MWVRHQPASNPNPRAIWAGDFESIGRVAFVATGNYVSRPENAETRMATNGRCHILLI